MISSLLRRVITTVQTAITRPPAAPPPATTPAATPYFQDALEQGRKSPVNLSGFGNVPSVAARAPVEAGVTASGGSEKVGPELLHLDAGWTPQGQGYDATRGEVLTSYYNDDHEVMISVQDKDSGAETLQVKLGGASPGGPAPTHGGGVATDGEFVYVSDTDHVFVYTREELERAAKEGTPAMASQVMDVPERGVVDDPNSDVDLVSAGSYMTVHDGYAYIGGYSPDGDGKAGAVWRFKIDEKTGALIEDSREGPIRAPDRAQGMTVVDGALIFTTGDKKLVYQPFESSADTFSADIEKRVDISNGLIDPYAQGVNVIDGELWVTYESGSDKYRDNVDNPREHIQRIPLEELDLEAACLTPEQLEG
ncbi:hypothetical protein [Corallococcus llansteffanensis]|uniref:Phytase n=1 Tax=Corallococcus llansteffanensis TaxID=2316731 RepID=A0A3A8Q7I1_9BACT|nr:hypothetical protein [Corallococcus llansteffanensis]RKH64616.1 hypothetical protein D7V93_07135 [Corallococcus llansteffanensis]